ncbi:AAA family ATPase [Aureimonas sp. SK2]|uniref:AAA family ATPase n=1 Tax=Aureimonas sp. SK2 TaxID=3015992 RepID=UPI002444CF42|nr:AAA family ATPase [Aureimonas sp. SK2]
MPPSPDELRRHAQQYLDDTAKRSAARDRILAGERPTLDELLSGLPPASGSLALDVRGTAILWLEHLRSQPLTPTNQKLIPAVEKLETVPAAATLRPVWKQAVNFTVGHPAFPPGMSLKPRLAWYCALIQLEGAVGQVVGNFNPIASFWRRAYVAGLATGAVVANPNDVDPDFQEQILGAGVVELSTVNYMLEAYLPFVLGRLSAGHVVVERTPEEEAEDRELEQETVTLCSSLRTVSKSGPETPAATHVVLRAVEGHRTAEKRDIGKMYAALTEPVPLRRMLMQHLRDLRQAWPHAVGIIDALGADLRFGEPIRFRPILLVGGPGTGKTSLAIAIAEVLELFSVVYPCATSADNSFGGTPSRWSTASASTPLELIRQSGIANPVVILDELEKAGRHHSGHLEHALLPFLEPHTASRYQETALEMSADLSAVNYLATCNSLDGISQPLRDRFRVMTMPDPGPEHVGALAQRIVSNLAIERKQEALIPPLDGEEEELLRQHWKGGSLRMLRRTVEAMLNVRDQLEVRQ